MRRGCIGCNRDNEEVKRRPIEKGTQLSFPVSISPGRHADTFPSIGFAPVIPFSTGFFLRMFEQHADRTES
jgi:hypothetical protein